MGLDKIVADRVGNKGVGFNSEIAGPTSTDENDLLRQVLPQDLNSFGMIPEFIGRTPVITRTQALDEDDLVRILTEPRNAIAKQYRRMFQLEGADLAFEPEALHEIAKLALARKTGARGLRSICDKLGTRDWFRVRCGIGRPPGRMPVADYVLSLPKKDAADDFAQATDLGCEAALFLIEHGLEKTQQKFN